MKFQSAITGILVAGILQCLSGCVIVEVGVSNPAPNISRIAVAPFVNLSPERSVDGRRFAEAYYTELQKTPGFQVIPVGVVETAMTQYGLNLDSPDDLLKLVEALDADAICFGAITEYTPYYPPRLGLQISWYTPGAPDFRPGVAVDPDLRKQLEREARQTPSMQRMQHYLKKKWDQCLTQKNSFLESPVIRAQNNLQEINPQQADWERALKESLKLAYDQDPAPRLPVLIGTENIPSRPEPTHQLTDHVSPELIQQMITEDPFPIAEMTEPYMSYTRVFDGASAEFTAALRDYLELSGDQRSGGWTGYLHRSEDFIRFCMHRMILEMLQLHGGEARKRWVFTTRKYD